MQRIACWSARHQKTAVAGWLAFVAIAWVVGQLVSASAVPQYDPGQAGRAEQELAQLKVVNPPVESVLVEVRTRASRLRSEAAAEVRKVAGQVEDVLAEMPAAARDIRTSFARHSRDGMIAAPLAALVTFQVGGPHSDADTTVLADLAAVARVQAMHRGMVVQEAGDASTDRVASAMLGQDFHQAEDTSIPLTVILLLAAFGALIAAGIPVLLAGTAVTAAVSLLAIPAQWLPVGAGTSEIVLVIGMAVGVDYSLFYLRREREERAAGHSQLAAIRIAAATSGKAIVISGLTVMFCLAGLFLTGIDLFTGISFGTIMVVAMAVLGSVTFLPALLSCLGSWVDRCRVPWIGRRRTAARPSRMWTRLVRGVVRRPAAWGGIAALAMLALCAPALGMRIGNPAVDLPTSLPVVHVLDEIQQQFPGRPAPAEVVVTGADLDGPAVQHAVTRLQAMATPGGLIRGPITAAPVDSGRALVLQVPLAGNGSDSASVAALLRLENQALPATIGHAGARFAVTGSTASNYDQISMLHSRSPLVFGVIALLAFLLLMAAFRSVTIPVISIGLNLLSVGAAYGVVTLIFQDGWLQGLIGFTSYGAVVPWVPLFTFVLLFGLSMDYHVFIVSRIRELRLAGASTPDAVVEGISRCAGVVSSAALIMVAVFSVFATLSMIDLKMLGVGLAVAVLIDATLVRGLILPAALALLGERSWYLPSWLEWLPGYRLAHDHQVAPAPASQGSGSRRPLRPAGPAADPVGP